MPIGQFVCRLMVLKQVYCAHPLLSPGLSMTAQDACDLVTCTGADLLRLDEHDFLRLSAGMPGGVPLVLGMVLGMDKGRPGQPKPSGIMQRLGTLSLKRVKETPKRPLPDQVVRPLQ
jgi:hypothetical protein